MDGSASFMVPYAELRTQAATRSASMQLPKRRHVSPRGYFENIDQVSSKTRKTWRRTSQ